MSKEKSRWFSGSINGTAVNVPEPPDEEQRVGLYERMSRLGFEKHTEITLLGIVGPQNPNESISLLELFNNMLDRIERLEKSQGGNCGPSRDI